MFGSMVCFTEPKSVITIILCTGGQTKNCRSEKPNGMWVTAREPCKLSVVQTLSIRSRSPTNEVIKVISGAAPRNRCHRPTWESSFRKILFHLTFLCCPQERSATSTEPPENHVILPLAGKHIVWYFIQHSVRCEMRPCLAIRHRERCIFNF